MASKARAGVDRYRMTVLRLCPMDVLHDQAIRVPLSDVP